MFRNLRTRKDAFASYSERYISQAKPSFLISYVDNDPRFWSISEALGIPLVIIQNGVRGGELDLDLTRSYRGVIHHLVAFNDSMAGLFETAVQVKNSHVFGSIRNNAIAPLLKPRSGIVWISQFQEVVSERHDYIEKWNALQREASSVIQKWAESRGVTFTVLMRSGRKPLSGEVEFFRENLGESAQLIQEKTGQAYEKVDTFRIAATFCSTLGHEALRRGGSVFFFNLGKSRLGDHTLNLGWPEPFIPRGAFWHDNMSEEKKIFAKLDRLYAFENGAFQLSNAAAVDKLMSSDVGNQKITNLLSRLIEK